ncbi:MAG: helix-turn-helix domain-containing protein [Caulobacteraceae bacterium]|nr:helix-turn-helix domain-containing protein [Caulobacter sp.]
MNGNQELGHFLRTRRAKAQPDDRRPATRRRRVPGLRREEVAGEAGISVEWYVKLEQGRAVSPSAETVAALSRALRLDPVDDAHLRALASRTGRPSFRPEAVPDALRRLVERLPEPAYLTGRRWDVLAWNAAAEALFGFAAMAPAARNIILFMMTDPAARRLFGSSWAVEARRMTALFRSAFDLWTGDAAFDALVDRIRTAQPDFDAWWTAHDVGAPVSGRKTLRHPSGGDLRYDYATFQANDDPALKLALYTRS